MESVEITLQVSQEEGSFHNRVLKETEYLKEKKKNKKERTKEGKT